jgi:signal transduction histidine kinase
VEERTAEIVRASEQLRRSEEELRLLSSQLLTAQENERGRIARELHDGLGQSLSAIKFKLEEVHSAVGKGIGEADVKSLGPIISLIQNAVEEVRRITMDLRPSTLDDLGILATITWFSREFQKIYSAIKVEREIKIDENDVPESLKIIIFRVLQEALNNAAKHSEANLVHLRLGKTEGSIELAVEDNGKGFEVEAALATPSSERGFGLGSMRERTELSGGSFVIDSVKGKGTTVRALWPYKELQE